MSHWMVKPAVTMGFLGAVVVSLAALSSAASVPSANVKRQVTQLRDQYDFVVLGGGTSGLRVENGLSASFPASKYSKQGLRHYLTKTETVLVVEYGDLQQNVPGVFDPPTDWI